MILTGLPCGLGKQCVLLVAREGSCLSVYGPRHIVPTSGHLHFGRWSIEVPPSTILTVEQAAEFLQVRPKTVRALAAGGQIPAAKVGRSWRFVREQIEAHVAQQAAQNVRVPRSSLPPGRISAQEPPGSLGERLDAILAQGDNSAVVISTARRGARR